MSASSHAERRGLGRLAHAWSAFWYSAEPDLRRLALFRVGFFGVVALDVWTHLGTAAPFAADFNVPHWPSALSWLPIPSLATVVVLRLVQFVLAARMVLGIGGRVTAALLAVSFGYTYFSSQLDSYQHHYLVFLVLVACSLIDWSRPRKSGWAVRLILVQLSLLYFWAAITKMDASWLEGDAVMRNAGPALQGLASLAAGKLGVPLGGFWAAASWLVLFTELLLAVGLHVERWRWPVWLTGMSLHATFLLGNLSIGLFTWYLFAVFFLVIPGRLLVLPGARRLERVRAWASSRVRGAHDWLVAGVRRGPALFVAALVMGAFATLALPLPGASAAALVVVALVVLSDVSSRVPLGPRAVAHSVLVVALMALHLGTGTTLRLAQRLAADARKRELPSEVQLALQERLVWQDPDNSLERRLLAKQLREAERHHEAAKNLELVVRLEPESASGWTELGGALLADGQGARAASAYQRAGRLDPLSAELVVLRGVATALDADALEERPALVTERDEKHAEALELFVKGGQMHVAASNWRLAADAYARAQRLAPERVDLMLELARLNQAQGRRQQAIAWAERALGGSPGDARALELITELGGQG